MKKDFDNKSSKKIQLIDVREKIEYAECHLKSAINIPLSQIMNGDLPKSIDKNITTKLYCNSGERATLCYHFLIHEGFKDLGVLDPTFEELITKYKLPFVKGKISADKRKEYTEEVIKAQESLAKNKNKIIKDIIKKENK